MITRLSEWTRSGVAYVAVLTATCLRSVTAVKIYAKVAVSKSNTSYVMAKVKRVWRGEETSMRLTIPYTTASCLWLAKGCAVTKTVSTLNT